MKTLNRLIAVLSGLVATLVFASAIAIAQPASQGAPASPPTGVSGDQGSMMGGGMMGVWAVCEWVAAVWAERAAWEWGAWAGWR